MGTGTIDADDTLYAKKTEALSRPKTMYRLSDMSRDDIRRVINMSVIDLIENSGGGRSDTVLRYLRRLRHIATGQAHGDRVLVWEAASKRVVETSGSRPTNEWPFK